MNPGTCAAVDLVDEVVAELMGIYRTDGRCLDLIDQHGRMTAGDLARDTGLSTGSVTAVLDRLESAGYVYRARDEVDRRRVYVEVTPETRARMHALFEPLVLRGQERLAGYTTEQLAMLRGFIGISRELTAEHVERLRAQLAEEREREGTIGRVRRTAKVAKLDVKLAVDEVKRAAKDAKHEVKTSAKGVKGEVKRAVKGR